MIINSDAFEYVHNFDTSRTLLIVDPPFELADKIPYADEFENKMVFWDSIHQKKMLEMYGIPNYIFVWDCVSSWYIPNRPLQRAKYCGVYRLSFNNRKALHGEISKQKLVSNSRGTYLKPQAEGTMLSTVWSHPITKFHSVAVHKHEKPHDWINAIVLGVSDDVDHIFDPFAGSGAFGIVAKKNGIEYTGIEIDSKMCEYANARIENWRDEKSKQLNLFDHI